MQHRLKIQNRGAKDLANATRALVSFLVFCLMVYLAFYHGTCVYLARQAKGQLSILLKAGPPGEATIFSARARENLQLVPLLKKYSVDSLGYDATGNYEKIYDHGRTPVLWVVTASKPFSLEPVEWSFPIVGNVSYKGFFDKGLAAAEYYSLTRRGLDAEVSPVTAYSTLGWFDDPLFSGMLERNKGSFCNLIFHELFHATWYQPGEVNLNENLASFIAHKATLQFLSNDSSSRAAYIKTHTDQQQLRSFLKRKAGELEDLYSSMKDRTDLPERKEDFFNSLADSVRVLPLSSRARGAFRAKTILSARNAYFVGYAQYESLQDSLEFAFNKIYRRNIKNMVHDLKRR